MGRGRPPPPNTSCAGVTAPHVTSTFSSGAPRPCAAAAQPPSNPPDPGGEPHGAMRGQGSQAASCSQPHERRPGLGFTLRAPGLPLPLPSQGWGGGGLLPSRLALLSPVCEGFVEGSQISDVPETNNLPLTRSLVSSHNRENTIFLTHCAIKTRDVKEHVAVS